jgi:hypothetical protein
MVRPHRREEGTCAIYMVYNSFRSLGTYIPNLKCYQSMRSEIIHMMDFVRGEAYVNTLVMMALAQGRGMFIIMEGGEADKVRLFSQIKEDFVSGTREMHGHHVKDISGMGKFQVCVGSVLKYENGNMVFHDLFQTWIWSLCWNCFGRLSFDKSGPAEKT